MRVRVLFRVSFWVCCLLWVWVLLSGSALARAQEKPAPIPGPQIQQIGSHNTITIQSVGTPGRYIGFDVLADDKLIAPIRFTSRELIFCPTAAIVNKGAISTLTFDNLQTAPDCGLALEHSRIVVTLASQQFPTVAFDLHVASFSPRQWEAAIGRQPFHFLTMSMYDATAWHQQGWLFATPRADLFPLLLDVHKDAPSLSAFPYNREWSRTPPLSAHARRLLVSGRLLVSCTPRGIFRRPARPIIPSARLRPAFATGLSCRLT